MSDDEQLASDQPVTDSVAQMAQLELVLEQHRQRLLSMLRRRIDRSLANRVDPDDLLSEVFLLAARRWSAFSAQPNANAYAWLYRLISEP